MKVGHKLLNRYVVEALVGEGATATVYRAHDMRLNRTVAVKALSPYVGKSARARFSREAKSAAALNHPGIMAIYDEIEDDGIHFLIIEYIEGQPLSNFIPASPELVADVGIQLCRALNYAHRESIIHRDIKPANIKVTEDGTVKIMDFGLAMTEDATHITAHGSIVGTPAYLSPEQARGHDLDHRTDIYSLGVMLYEMITGALPFDANDIGTILLKKVTENPFPPSERVPETPEWLDAAVMMALEKDRDKRVPSAAELAIALGDDPTRRTTGTGPLSDAAAAVAAQAPPGKADADVRAPEKQITVILADDHTILRTTLAMYLDAQPDIRVMAEAASGDEVIALFETHVPDVLLLDLNMPGQGGLEVLPQVRRTHPHTQVLVLTGQAEDAYIMRALQAGAHGYLLKTCSQEELVDSVRKVSEGHLVLGTGVAEHVVAGMISSDQHEQLDDGELAVLGCVVAGYEKNEAIAERLDLTSVEVASALMRAIDKLGVQSRAEAALAALRSGWITLDDAHQM